MNTPWNRIVFVALLMALLAMVSGPSAASDIDVQWKNGLVFSSDDGHVQTKIGGRIMNDWAFFSADDELDASLGKIFDASEVRRARIAVSGVLPGMIEYKAQYDFAGAEVTVKDMWVGMKHVVGNAGIRVGHFNQPVGLELLTSSNYISLMERSTLNEFVPGRKSGVMVHGTLGEAKRGSFAISAYRNSDDGGDVVADESWSVSTRWTVLVMDSENGDLVHLGVSGTARNNDSDLLAVALAPESHLAPEFNEMEFGADSWKQIGLEAAAVIGSVHLQAEQMFVSADALDDGDDPTFTAFSAQAGIFLTGERRPYKRSSAAFNRLKPLKNFRSEGGYGAVELAARYSRLDLSDGSVDGGELDGFTAGVNWYLNSNARLMLNYVYSDGSSPSASGTLQAVQTRFHVSF